MSCSHFTHCDSQLERMYFCKLLSLHCELDEWSFEIRESFFSFQNLQCVHLCLCLLCMIPVTRIFNACTLCICLLCMVPIMRIFNACTFCLCLLCMIPITNSKLSTFQVSRICSFFFLLWSSSSLEWRRNLCPYDQIHSTTKENLSNYSRMLVRLENLLRT